MNYYFSTTRVDGLYFTVIYRNSTPDEPLEFIENHTLQSADAAKSWANLRMAYYKIRELEESLS